MLPKDIYCNSTPICTTTSSNEMFQSTFHLPSTVPKECRRITGTQSPSKKRSKLNAAFQCVKKLWEFGELDSRFRPIHLKVDENGKILPSIRRIGATTVRSFHPCIPLAFQGDWTTNQVYLSIISICLVDSLKPSYKVDANIPVLNSKTFKLGIITQNRIQSDSDVFKFGLPVREEGGHLGVELTNSGPIQVDDLSIIKFRVFHSKTMGAFFRIPLKPEFDYAYFIAPVIDGNLDYSVLDDVYGKVEISVFDHLKFKGILAEFVALVESSGVSEEADESMDVHNSVVNESEPVISMDVQNTDTIMCADAIQSIKQSGDSFESESVEIKGNVFEPAADSMMHQLKEPSINPNEETSTRSNSEIKVQKTSNDGTTEMNIDTLKESTKDKPAEFVLPPVPDVSTPYEGSLLEYINSKIRTSEQIKEDCIVTDHFYYGRHYRILEIIDSMTPFDEFENEKLKKQFKNFKTVADFYKIRLKCWETIIKDQPVIKAAVIPQFSQPARLIAKYGEGVADQRNIDLPPLRSQIQPPPVYLLPQFCRVYPVSKQILCEEAYHIPMIVRQLDHAVRVSEFKSDFKFDFVDTMKLQEALTAPSSHQPYDYERLENLGDSFLKILISLHLFSSNPSFHEGRLTSERNILEGNRNFTSRAVKSGILNIILTESLTKTLWSPLMRCSVERDANMKENDLFFAPKDSDDEPIAADDPSTILEDAPVSSEPTIQVSAQTSVVSDNTIADCMEAVIGSCILAAGINAGSYAASRLLNPNFQANWNIGYGKMLREAGYYSEPETVMTPELLSSLEFVESCIDYKFKNRKLLIEALTHPSMTLTKPTETCYPRLEFLGDAILHFIITIYIYSRYPLLSPGAISEYRSSLVCNQFLSIVCAHLKIHDHIIHASTTFKISMNEFTNIMKDSPPFAHKLGDRNDVLDYSPEIDVASMKRQTGAFWNEFEKAPKAIADVYESILGAVFVDSLDLDSECVFDLSVITSVIEKTLLLPWLPILGPPSSVQIHPVKALIDYVASVVKCRELKISFY